MKVKLTSSGAIVVCDAKIHHFFRSKLNLNGGIIIIRGKKMVCWCKLADEEQLKRWRPVSTSVERQVKRELFQQPELPGFKGEKR